MSGLQNLVDYSEGGNSSSDGEVQNITKDEIPIRDDKDKEEEKKSEVKQKDKSIEKQQNKKEDNKMNKREREEIIIEDNNSEPPLQKSKATLTIEQLWSQRNEILKPKSHVNYKVPQINKPCDENLKLKFDKLYNSMIQNKFSFLERLSQNPNFRNPHLYNTLSGQFKLDQYGSNFNRQEFDTSRFMVDREEKSLLQRQREQNRSTIEFTKPKEDTYNPYHNNDRRRDNRFRKSKWDVRSRK